MMDAHIVLSRLEGVRRLRDTRWLARCPAHGSVRHTPLQIDLAEDRILVKCWAGCTYLEVVESIGLKARDLFEGNLTVEDRWALDVLRSKKARRERLQMESMQREVDKILNCNLRITRAEQMLGIAGSGIHSSDLNWGTQGQPLSPHKTIKNKSRAARLLALGYRDIDRLEWGLRRP